MTRDCQSGRLPPQTYVGESLDTPRFCSNTVHLHRLILENHWTHHHSTSIPTAYTTTHLCRRTTRWTHHSSASIPTTYTTTDLCRRTTGWTHHNSASIPTTYTTTDLCWRTTAHTTILLQSQHRAPPQTYFGESLDTPRSCSNLYTARNKTVNQQLTAYGNRYGVLSFHMGTSCKGPTASRCQRLPAL